jgi:hypothetical protein
VPTTNRRCGRTRSNEKASVRRPRAPRRQRVLLQVPGSQVNAERWRRHLVENVGKVDGWV